MRFKSILLLALVSGGLCLADSPDRWIPGRCLEITADDSGSQATWNESYGEGFRAVQLEEYDAAEAAFCRALVAAREFGPRDWRFAETLDELGLIAYSLRDFDLAERVQGAAIAEMLLAVGPHGEPLRGREGSAIRSDCASGVGVYTERLGWIHREVSGRVATEELERAPWQVFAAGYLPLDDRLAERLDWLVSQYLLEENLTAAEELTVLQRRIREAVR